MHDTNPLMENPRWTTARRITEGRRRWGVYETGLVDRGGWSRYELCVYPPGTNSRERRLLNIQRNGPVAGAFVAVATLMTLSEFVPVIPLIAAVVGGYGLLVVAGRVTTKSIRRECARMRVVTIPDRGARMAFGDPELLADCWRTMRTADRDLESGSIDMVRYELIWAEVHRLVGASSASGADTDRPRLFR
jgi:hypothetical protein